MPRNDFEDNEELKDTVNNGWLKAQAVHFLQGDFQS
jgi:hypothetical protein